MKETEKLNEEKQRFRDNTFPKVVSFALNRYALENVAFGDIKKETKFLLKNMWINYIYPTINRKNIEIK